MQRDLLKARMGKLSAAEAEAGLNAQADALVEDDEEAEELDSFGALPSTSSYKLSSPLCSLQHHADLRSAGPDARL